MRRFWHFILMVIIFIVITLSPIWSVILVMECEAGWMEIGWKYQMGWSQSIIIDDRRHAEWKKVGLGVKYDKL